MKLTLHDSLTENAWAREAEHIIEKCVHCGFCNATCPTYLERGDERDGPRGRIYLVKQLLENGSVTDKSVRHFDRCLTCRSCETTCPSSVSYGRLFDLARDAAEAQAERPWYFQLLRWLLLQILPYPSRFGPLLRLGQLLQPLLPGAIASEIPAVQKVRPYQLPSLARTMLLLGGCAQACATPRTNIAASKVFARLGIALIEPDTAGCCGAASYHLSAHEAAREFARKNIDAWWPYIEKGAEAIVVTASGCGTSVKDYDYLLKDDPHYASKAKRASELAKDISEVLSNEDLSQLQAKPYGKSLAIHCPCSLQHGQQLPQAIHSILKTMGIEGAETTDNHLCCGAAGTYTVLQPALSRRLRDKKISSLMTSCPQEIVTANVGCQMHLAAAATVPVKHWIEVLDEITR